MTQLKYSLLALAASLSVVIIFAVYPNFDAHQTGLAGYVTAAIFITTWVLGSLSKRLLAVSIIIVLAFIEPETRITDTVTLKLITNGILGGAVLRLFFDRSSIKMSWLFATVIVYSFIAFWFPLINANLGLIDIYTSFIFLKYGAVILLAGSLPKTKQTWKFISASIMVGSLLVAFVLMIQTTKIPVLDNWMWNVYLWARLDNGPETASNILDTNIRANYFRAWGVGIPAVSAGLLSISLGAWFAFLAATKNRRLVIVTIGLSFVILGILVTGNRGGSLALILGLGLGLYYWNHKQRPTEKLKLISITMILCVGLLAILATTNTAFYKTILNSYDRTFTAIPRVINGVPDKSIEARIDEYHLLDISLIGTKQPRKQFGSDYLTVMNHLGIIGLIFYLAIFVGIYRNTYKSLVGIIAFSSLAIVAFGLRIFEDEHSIIVLFLLVPAIPRYHTFSTRPEHTPSDRIELKKAGMLWTKN